MASRIAPEKPILGVGIELVRSWYRDGTEKVWGWYGEFAGLANLAKSANFAILPAILIY